MNRYVPGAWNVDCAQCCRKFKNYELSRDWRGVYLCRSCWDPRHPQDFVRAAAERPGVPWTQDFNTVVQVAVCTPNGQSAVPDCAVPNCAVPSYIHPYFDPTINEV